MVTQRIKKGLVDADGKMGSMGPESQEGFLWDPCWTLTVREDLGRWRQACPRRGMV